MIFFNKHDITGIHRNNIEMVALYLGDLPLWEVPTGFIFTTDQFSLHTADGFVIKCKDQ